jgi:putative ABC transport system permease protein
MNVFKIAWRSIQHRGIGSFLTILSMALGIMMVVSVISIHGVVSQSFKNSRTFGYNVLVGARGGSLQLTMSSVYYLAPPVENIPYEYYLAFVDQEQRQREMKHSLAWVVHQHEQDSMALANLASGSFGSTGALTDSLGAAMSGVQQMNVMGYHERGLFDSWTHTVVPINLGDFWVDEDTDSAFRCVGTSPSYFTEMVLDIETERRLEFAEGRPFDDYNDEHGFYEVVIGSAVAKQSGLKIGDTIQPTHGDPNSSGSHLHETDFYVVGILAPSGTPSDRVLFLNMEGFFLMEGHTKSIKDDSVRGATKRAREDREAAADGLVAEESVVEDSNAEPSADESDQEPVRLPIERREVTSLLVRTVVDDSGLDTTGFIMVPQINQGDLNSTLEWTPFKPERGQEAAMAVNPVEEVFKMFAAFIDPIQLALLALTLMICVVSSISILVGIYNSMSQRRKEIAVMRALGASRAKVLMIMLCESILIALTAGLIGWIAGHALNLAMAPTIEAKTGIQLGFFDLAPSIPMAFLPGGSLLPTSLATLKVSPELLLVPGLVLLAVIVGIYPAISAYRTDVSQSLGK